VEREHLAPEKARNTKYLSINIDLFIEYNFSYLNSKELDVIENPRHSLP
jgi:hypothetical protein